MPMRYCLLNPSQRMAISFIVSHHVSQIPFHPLKVKRAAYQNHQGGRKGNGYHRPRAGIGSQQRPTKPFHYAGHRIEAIKRPPGFGQQTARISYWRDEHPELSYKRHHVADITVFHIQRRKPQPDPERRDQSQQEEEWQPQRIYRWDHSVVKHHHEEDQKRQREI